MIEYLLLSQSIFSPTLEQRDERCNILICLDDRDQIKSKKSIAIQHLLQYGYLRSKGNQMLVKWVILGRFLWFLYHFKANFKGYLMIQTIL